MLMVIQSYKFKENINITIAILDVEFVIIITNRASFHRKIS